MYKCQIYKSDLISVNNFMDYNHCVSHDDYIDNEIICHLNMI